MHYSHILGLSANDRRVIEAHTKPDGLGQAEAITPSKSLFQADWEQC